jgi:acetoin utilization protein AcuB
MEVAELMTEDVLYLQPGDLVGEARRMMHDEDIRHVPVVDDGELVGIISDRDIQRFETAKVAEEEDERPLHYLDRALADVMQTDVLTVSPSDDVSDAVDLMIEHKVSAIPVVDQRNRSLAGILSYIDVLVALRDKL